MKAAQERKEKQEQRKVEKAKKEREEKVQKVAFYLIVVTQIKFRFTKTWNFKGWKLNGKLKSGEGVKSPKKKYDA